MSTDAVAGFLSALEEDGPFKEQCRRALETEGQEAVVKLAAERGWKFTAEEFAEHVGGGDELDDDVLDKVAGGTLGARRSPRVVRGAFTRTFVPSRGMANQNEDEEVQM